MTDEKRKPVYIQEILGEPRLTNNITRVASTIHPIDAIEAEANAIASLKYGKEKRWVRISAWIFMGIPMIFIMIYGIKSIIQIFLEDSSHILPRIGGAVFVGFMFIFLPGCFLYMLLSRKKRKEIYKPGQYQEKINQKFREIKRKSKARFYYEND